MEIKDDVVDVKPFTIIKRRRHKSDRLMIAFATALSITAGVVLGHALIFGYWTTILIVTLSWYLVIKVMLT